MIPARLGQTTGQGAIALATLLLTSAFAVAAGNDSSSLRCRFCGIPPVIDGSLDDLCWSRCEVATDFQLLDGAGRATQQTECMTAYDARNLYLAFVCHESDPSGIRAQCYTRNGPVWFDDCVEAFLDTRFDRYSYYHLIANSIAVPYDDMVDAHGVGDYAPYLYRTRDYGKTWTSIVKGLPADALAAAVQMERHGYRSKEAERLREDFEVAQMGGPRVAQNWDRFLTVGDRGGFRGDSGLAEGPRAARDRVQVALKCLTHPLDDLALLVIGPAIFGGDAAHDLLYQRPAIVAVGHDHDAFAVQIAEQIAVEARVAAAVGKRFAAGLISQADTQAVIVEQFGEHRALRGGFQDVATVLEFEHDTRQIGRRGPQTGRS